MAVLTVDCGKHSRPTPADDIAAEIITDCDIIFTLWLLYWPIEKSCCSHDWLILHSHDRVTHTIIVTDLIYGILLSQYCNPPTTLSSSKTQIQLQLGNDTLRHFPAATHFIFIRTDRNDSQCQLGKKLCYSFDFVELTHQLSIFLNVSRARTLGVQSSDATL